MEFYKTYRWHQQEFVWFLADNTNSDIHGLLPDQALLRSQDHHMSHEAICKNKNNKKILKNNWR